MGQWVGAPFFCLDVWNGTAPSGLKSSGLKSNGLLDGSRAARSRHKIGMTGGASFL